MPRAPEFAHPQQGLPPPQRAHRLRSRPLAPPRVPRDVRGESSRLVRTALSHCTCSSGWVNRAPWPGESKWWPRASLLPGKPPPPTSCVRPGVAPPQQEGHEAAFCVPAAARGQLLCPFRHHVHGLARGIDTFGRQRLLHRRFGHAPLDPLPQQVTDQTGGPAAAASAGRGVFGGEAVSSSRPRVASRSSAASTAAGGCCF